MKIIVSIIPTDLVINSFKLFLSFLTNQKQESGFQQGGGLVTGNISVFCLWRVALYFKAMPNSIKFYKGIFLHVIPVRIIVPWDNQRRTLRRKRLILTKFDKKSSLVYYFA